MDAHKLLGIQLSFQTADSLAQKMRLLAAVHRHVVAFGFNPLGAALCGLLLEHIGSTPTVLFFAACYLAMALITQLNPQVRNARPLG